MHKQHTYLPMITELGYITTFSAVKNIPNCIQYTVPVNELQFKRAYKRLNEGTGKVRSTNERHTGLISAPLTELWGIPASSLLLYHWVVGHTGLISAPITELRGIPASSLLLYHWVVGHIGLIAAPITELWGIPAWSLLLSLSCGAYRPDRCSYHWVVGHTGLIAASITELLGIPAWLLLLSLSCGTFTIK